MFGDDLFFESHVIGEYKLKLGDRVGIACKIDAGSNGLSHLISTSAMKKSVPEFQSSYLLACRVG